MNNAVSTIKAFVRALRVYQWTKNLVVFAALVFAQEFTDSNQVVLSIGAFFALCAASSATYLFNDIIDVEKDRRHPEKCRRPLASGAIRVPTAAMLLVFLCAGSLVGAYAIRPQFAAAVLAYILLIVAYTLVLKRIVLVDVLVVAVGFVIRAVSGALALDVSFSNWLVVCTFFLALFLILGKRRHEIEIMEDDAVNHREVLGHYTRKFLDAIMIVVAATTLLAYTIYTCTSEVVERLGTDKLYVTLPFVVYGLFRYLYLVYHKQTGGDPSKTLLQDAPLMVTVALWGAANVVIIYVGMPS
jgi:4-hydroxybenzoate polyprenyltransferase